MLDRALNFIRDLFFSKDKARQIIAETYDDHLKQMRVISDFNELLQANQIDLEVRDVGSFVFRKSNQSAVMFTAAKDLSDNNIILFSNRKKFMTSSLCADLFFDPIYTKNYSANKFRIDDFLIEAVYIPIGASNVAALKVSSLF